MNVNSVNVNNIILFIADSNFTSLLSLIYIINLSFNIHKKVVEFLSLRPFALVHFCVVFLAHIRASC